MPPFNKPSELWFILLNTAVYGGNEYMYGIKIWSLVYFHLHVYEALNDAFEVLFFRASFLRLIKDTDSM